jgi:anti-sigma factor RsiW
MTWTCEQTELRLTDYLDGLLSADEQHTFDVHVNSCQRCTPLVMGVTHAVRNLHLLPELEAPLGLVNSILDSTLGPRQTVTGWAAVLALLRGIASPKFAYGALSVAATFLMLVTASGFNWKKPKLADLAPANIYRNTNRQVHLAYARGTKYVSDLRVVYEIQSRLRQDNELPNNPESTVPESSPKQPGTTDGTPPVTPRQQNRANDNPSHLQVLAEELPFLSGKLDLISSGTLGVALGGKPTLP